MFDCVLENTIENTFSTCCSHFLTFSRLPNEYIISFIPQNTNKTQKKIIKSGQKKVRSRSARLALRAIAINASRDRDQRVHAIGAVPVMSANGAVPVMSQSLSLSLSLLFSKAGSHLK